MNTRGGGSRINTAKGSRNKTPNALQRRQSRQTTASYNQYGGNGVWPRTQTAKASRRAEPVYMTFKEMREKQRIAE